MGVTACHSVSLQGVGCLDGRVAEWTHYPFLHPDMLAAFILKSHKGFAMLADNI